MRTTRGETLVSLLIATLLMTISATALLALMSVNTRVNGWFWNKANVLTSARFAIDRIGRQVRSARSLGDCYGLVSPSTTPAWNLTTHGPSTNIAGVNKATTTNALLNGTAFLISPAFPSPGDPYYCTSAGAAQAPNGGWPWQANPQIGGAPAAPGVYQLAQDTLIVQVPVFVSSTGLDPSQAGPGAQCVWPVSWNGQTAGGANGSLEAMDTYVYRVIPDPSAPGTWMMQEACFQACPAGNSNPQGGAYNGHPTNAVLPTPIPVTILKGIVGPMDATGNPQVFSYVERVNNTTTTTPPDATHYLTDYTGVIVNLEVLKSAEGVKRAVAAFRSEFFFRNNTMAELIGLPPPG